MMTAVLQVPRKKEVTLTTDQLLHRLIYDASRELGLPKWQAEQAADGGMMKVDGIQISISCLETDVQKDAIVVAKLAVMVCPDSIRQLLEINLIAAIALHSTISIDSDGDAILLALLPIEKSDASFFANHVSQMALFATTVQQQIGKSL